MEAINFTPNLTTSPSHHLNLISHHLTISPSNLTTSPSQHLNITTSPSQPLNPFVAYISAKYKAVPVMRPAMASMA